MEQLSLGAHDGRWTSPTSARRDLGVLTSGDLSQLRHIGRHRSAGTGQLVLTVGSPATHVVAVVHGELELRSRIDSGPVAMAVVRRGGVVGDVPMLLETPMPFDALATQPTDLVLLSKRRWMGLVTSRPALCQRWTSSLARRLDDDRRRLVMVQSRPLIAQVAYLLLDLADRDGQGVLQVRLTQATMAQLIGARRQSVTRVFGELRDHGLIQTGYATTDILDEQGLAALMGPPPVP